MVESKQRRPSWDPLRSLVGAYAALFAATFPVVPFFDEAFCACSNSARFNAQRRFVASMILFLPAALSLRLRFGASDVTVCKEGADCCLVSGHRFRCASAIPFRPASLILRRFRFGGSAAPDLVRPPVQHRSKFAYLRVQPFLLTFEAFNGGGNDLRV